MLTDLEIITSFATKETINNTLYSIKTKMEFDKGSYEELTPTQRKKVCDLYKQKIYTRLTTVLRRQIFLDTEEAVKFYSNNINVLNERINILFDTLNFINDDLDVTFIPDRLLVCAFFRINAETYDVLLNDVRTDITEEVRKNFTNIEELILSMTTNALENGNLGQSAWKRLSLKAKFGGSEIRSVENNSIPSKVLLATTEDVTNRLNTSYNFAELELENKKEG